MSTLPTTPKVPATKTVVSPPTKLTLSEWAEKNINRLDKFRPRLGRLKQDGIIHKDQLADGEKAIRILKGLFSLGV